MSLRNHWDLVRSCPNISNRRTRRRVEWRVSSPAGYKVSVSRRDREGTRCALGATIKGRPLNDARPRNTATAYSIVCNAALSLSLSFAVVALHVTGDCTKSASRDRQCARFVQADIPRPSQWRTRQSDPRAFAQL